MEKYPKFPISTLLIFIYQTDITPLIEEFRAYPNLWNISCLMEITNFALFELKEVRIKLKGERNEENISLNFDDFVK